MVLIVSYPCPWLAATLRVTMKHVNSYKDNGYFFMTKNFYPDFTAREVKNNNIFTLRPIPATYRP